MTAFEGANSIEYEGHRDTYLFRMSAMLVDELSEQDWSKPLSLKLVRLSDGTYDLMVRMVEVP